jgi:hypothetical protein
MLHNLSINLSLIFLLGILSCTDPIKKDIYGKWFGNHDNNKIIFIFNRDNSFSLNYYNKNPNKDKLINGVFVIDYTKSPIPLSIKDISQLNHSLYTIIDFIEADSIIISYFSEQLRLRPISFSNNNIFSLTRKYK